MISLKLSLHLVEPAWNVKTPPKIALLECDPYSRDGRREARDQVKEFLDILLREVAFEDGKPAEWRKAEVILQNGNPAKSRSYGLLEPTVGADRRILDAARGAASGEPADPGPVLESAGANEIVSLRNELSEVRRLAKQASADTARILDTLSGLADSQEFDELRTDLASLCEQLASVGAPELREGLAKAEKLAEQAVEDAASALGHLKRAAKVEDIRELRDELVSLRRQLTAVDERDPLQDLADAVRRASHSEPTSLDVQATAEPIRRAIIGLQEAGGRVPPDMRTLESLLERQPETHEAPRDLPAFIVDSLMGLARGGDPDQDEADSDHALHDVLERWVLDIVDNTLNGVASAALVSACEALMNAVGCDLIYPSMGTSLNGMEHEQAGVDRNSVLGEKRIVRVAAPGYRRRDGDSVRRRARVIVSMT